MTDVFLRGAHATVRGDGFEDEVGSRSRWRSAPAAPRWR